ncbi:MAG: [FeFe] hydrogenase H-cluster maturation GTPase HydF, partial [Oscillospiraceae bacterium]|jgi:[FeFe] hydrogenase H-cluster maturation GTPase HydF|nr:[FeFe] hydrogenase H-cluster maturation GTPase HydF [Oscillospiraceae bacterium]
LLIDCPGFDDTGILGKLRVEKARQVLAEADAAVLVVDAALGLQAADRELLELFRAQGIPFLIAMNKSDAVREATAPPQDDHPLFVSAKTGENIALLKERLARLTQSGEPKLRLVADLLHPGDFALLVTPIDKAAPKGRLILPQQQVIRDILEADAAAIVVKEFELRDTLASLGKSPALVITDSQVFAKVSADVPPNVPLTSFSILFARYKGFLDAALQGVKALETLPAGASVLIAEGCTHHRQCDDIGTVKLPRWIRNELGKSFGFHFCSGVDFPEDLSPFALVIHCGGCMLNERTVRHRLRTAAAQGVPFTNYGIAIAWLQGILERSTRMLT